MTLLSQGFFNFSFVHIKSYHIKFTLIHTEGFDPVYQNEISLQIDILQKEIIFSSFCRRNLCNISICSLYFDGFISQKKVFLINSSTEGFHPVYSTLIFLMIDIFSERNHILVLLYKEFSNALKCGSHFEKSISQKKVLLIDISREEFYLVRENSILL